MRIYVMLKTLVLALALVTYSKLGLADPSFPNRPIELIVPSAPGAPSDVAVRGIASRWSETLGQPVVVLKRPGAGGAIAARQVVNAKADGYTLLTGYDSVLVALPIVSKPGYDLDSFSYIGTYATGPIYLMVQSNSPWTDIKGLIAAAKSANPPLTYASYGVGVITHFTAERLWELAGVKLTYVPYKSSPETAQALLGGVVNLAFTAGTGGVGANPRIRILAVAGDKRREQYPNVPTLKEMGYDVSLDYIAGIMGPKGLPDSVEMKLRSTLLKVMKDHEVEITQGVTRAEMSFLPLDGPETRKRLMERAAWFSQVAPRMNLNK